LVLSCDVTSCWTSGVLLPQGYIRWGRFAHTPDPFLTNWSFPPTTGAFSCPSARPVFSCLFPFPPPYNVPPLFRRHFPPKTCIGPSSKNSGAKQKISRSYTSSFLLVFIMARLLFFLVPILFESVPLSLLDLLRVCMSKMRDVLNWFFRSNGLS